MTESPFDSPTQVPAPDPTSPCAPSGETALSRRGALALGVLAGAAALTLPKLPARALDLGLPSELKFLENAQYLQNQFFTRALATPGLDDLTPRDTVAIDTIAREDGEQARFFRIARARGGVLASAGTQPASLTAPTFTIGAGNFANRAKFLDSAIALKTASVGAYHGIVGQGGKPEIVQAIAALAGVQNRHLAILKELAGQDPFVTYVEAMPLQEAARALAGFGFGTEVNR